jgi:predicted nucleic-acid-binding protein
MVWVLGSIYKIERAGIVQLLKAITSMSSLKLVNTFQTEVANRLYESKSVKYIDALIASVPEIENRKWVVVSYDKDFDSLGVVRREPNEVKAG